MLVAGDCASYTILHDASIFGKFRSHDVLTLGFQEVSDAIAVFLGRADTFLVPSFVKSVFWASRLGILLSIDGAFFGKTYCFETTDDDSLNLIRVYYARLPLVFSPYFIGSLFSCWTRSFTRTLAFFDLLYLSLSK